MLAKIVLWLSAIIFTAYGLACLVSPDLPADYAGLAITNGDARAEMAAMYGGLQTAFGLLCLWGALRREMQRPVLIMLVTMIGGLALARLYATLTIGDGAVGGYTYGALVFEWTTTILSALALKMGER